MSLFVASWTTTYLRWNLLIIKKYSICGISPSDNTHRLMAAIAITSISSLYAYLHAESLPQKPLSENSHPRVHSWIVHAFGTNPHRTATIRRHYHLMLLRSRQPRQRWTRQTQNSCPLLYDHPHRQIRPRASQLQSYAPTHSQWFLQLAERRFSDHSQQSPLHNQSLHHQILQLFLLLPRRNQPAFSFLLIILH